MSTRTPVSKTDTQQRTVTTLPRQRTHTPIRPEGHGRTTFAIVSLLTAGVGVTALWIGIGTGSDEPAAPLAPSRVLSNYDTSANAWEHRMLTQDALPGTVTRPGVRGQTSPVTGGQSSANAVEHANQYNLTPLEWERALDGMNHRAKVEAEAASDAAGQSSANAMEKKLAEAGGYQTPQERAQAHQLPR